MLKRNELGQCKKLIILLIIIIVIIKTDKVIVKVGSFATMLNHVFQNMRSGTTFCFDEKKSCEKKM